MSTTPPSIDSVLAGLRDGLAEDGRPVPPPQSPISTYAEAAADLFRIAAQSKASVFSVWAEDTGEEVESGISFFFIQPDPPGMEGLLGAERVPVRQPLAIEHYRPLGQALSDLAKRGSDARRPARGEVAVPFDATDPDVVFRAVFKDGALGTWVTAVARDRETRAALLPLAALPLSGDELAFLEERLLRLDTLFQGQMVLFTGERGSGRSTSFHAVLDAIPDGVNALAAVERPKPVDARTGVTALGPELTLTRALRAFLRQDPDMVFADEARTSEDLTLLIHSAMTGHATLAVLEAKTPEAALARLREALRIPMTPLFLHHTVDAATGTRAMALYEVQAGAEDEEKVIRWVPRG